MFLAMILAHLVGDYILQTNRIALWKSRSLLGVTVHCTLVYGVTWLFAIPFQPAWFVVPLIGLSHFAIDAGQFLFKPKMNALTRFTLDQLAHFIMITVALQLDGQLHLSAVAQGAVRLVENEQAMRYVLGYAFLTMPAWVAIKFTVYGLVTHSPPQFADDDKYLGIIERVLIGTFVIVGQYYLVPLVVAPRLMLNYQEVSMGKETAVFLTETLISTTVAVAVGLMLSLI